MLDASDLAERLEGPDGLTRERSAFTRRDVLQAFAEHARDGASVTTIESRADAFLTRDRIVELESLAGERRYSTRELLQLEQDAIERAQQPRPSAAAVADGALASALAGRPSIARGAARAGHSSRRAGAVWRW